MAGGSAKKGAVRRTRAALLYGGLIVAANLAYFAARLGLLPRVAGDWPLTRREWTGALFLGGCYALSFMSLLSAAEVDVTPEASLDLLVLTVLVQLGSLYSPRAWWLLALIPLYGLWSSRSLLAGLAAQGSGQPAGQAAAAAPAAEDDEMAEKRKRRAEHKAKQRGLVMRR